MKTTFLRSSFLSLCALLLTAQAASAAVYVCSGRETTHRYLIAEGENGKALLFSNQDGYFKHLPGTAKAVHAMDGGPLSVHFLPAYEAIDWSKEKSCYVQTGTGLNFSISANQVDGSLLTLFQNIVYRPGDSYKTCRTPVAAIAPQPISCTLLTE